MKKLGLLIALSSMTFPVEANAINININDAEPEGGWEQPNSIYDVSYLKSEMFDGNKLCTINEGCVK